MSSSLSAVSISCWRCRSTAWRTSHWSCACAQRACYGQQRTEGVEPAWRGRSVADLIIAGDAFSERVGRPRSRSSYASRETRGSAVAGRSLAQVQVLGLLADPTHWTTQAFAVSALTSRPKSRRKRSLRRPLPERRQGTGYGESVGHKSTPRTAPSSSAAGSERVAAQEVRLGMPGDPNMGDVELLGPRCEDVAAAPQSG